MEILTKKKKMENSKTTKENLIKEIGLDRYNQIAQCPNDSYDHHDDSETKLWAKEATYD